jgi:hypothetical protein
MRDEKFGDLADETARSIVVSLAGWRWVSKCMLETWYPLFEAMYWLFGISFPRK